MTLLPQYLSAEAFERHLGDPMNPEQAFSFKRVIESDELESYPTELCKLLHQCAFDEYYIPSQYGGKLTSFEEMLAISRVIARRDLTVTIAHGSTYLGSAVIWLGGSDGQKKHLAARIRQGQKIAFGLTEKSHGSDILANETWAQKVDQGYVLTGEKWLIGNGTRSGAISVFARTHPKGGPRGFSWFLVEKDRLEPNSYTHLPKIKTHGLRGADISGIRFQNCFVPEDALVGSLGSGLELALKALQINRTLHAGAAPSLGQADTALRTTLTFALSRQLYGRNLWEMPNVNHTLISAFLDILICECLSISAVRSLHTAPDQMSLFSAIVKYLAPTQVDALISKLAAVLGARYYLREEHCWGIFQKIVRDHAIVSVFDGSAAVNLHSIVLQLYQLASHRTTVQARAHVADDEALQVYLDTTFNLTQPLPPFNPNQLELYNRGLDYPIQGLETALAQLKTLSSTDQLAADVLEAIIKLTHYLIDKIRQQDAFVLELGGQHIAKLSKSSDLFELAQQYCLFHAATTCVLIWAHNRQRLGDFFARGEWLALSLQRLLQQACHEKIPGICDESAYRGKVGEELLRLHRADQLFSIAPLQLAR